MTRDGSCVFKALTGAMLVSALSAASGAAQTGAPGKTAAKTETAKKYTPRRTPWGDPDLSGAYTNNDESGIPIERPTQFEGKKLEDVSEGELEQLRAQREQQRVAIAPNLGGIPGTNPVHWFENFGAKNSRAWLLVEPADGKIPPRTAEAQNRPPQRFGSSFGAGPFNGPDDFSLYDRCITRGIPGSMMPAIYGNAYQILQSPGWWPSVTR